MRSAIIYARVSTVKQGEGLSMEAQVQRCKMYCNLHGLEVIGIHEDCGVSGTKDDRPGLAKAVQETIASSGVFVVYSLSRAARSMRKTIDLADQLGKAGAQFASVSENIDTTTAAGTMVFNLLAALAQFERDTISERTSMGLQYRKAQGLAHGEDPLFYRRVVINGVKTKQLEVCPEDVAHAKRMIEMQKDGISLRRMVKMLAAEGKVSRRTGKAYSIWTAAKMCNRLVEENLA